jgi:hypothetical protein
MENPLLAVDAGDKTARIVANRPQQDKPNCEPITPAARPA